MYAAAAASNSHNAVVAQATAPPEDFVDPLETLQQGGAPTAVVRVRGLPFTVVLALHFELNRSLRAPAT